MRTTLTCESLDRLDQLDRRLLILQQMLFAASHDKSGVPFSTAEASPMYYGLTELLGETRRGIRAALRTRASKPPSTTARAKRA